MITVQTYNYNELEKANSEAKLVLVFGLVSKISDPKVGQKLADIFSKAEIVFHSCKAQSYKQTITEELVIQALYFEFSEILATEYELNTDEQSAYELGQKIGADLRHNDNKLCLLFSAIKYDAGGELISGINDRNQHFFPMFGALATATVGSKAGIVGLNSSPNANKIVVLQFKGEKLKVQQAIDQSWKPFGLNYNITEAEGDTLFKINEENAYDLIKSVLNPADEEEFKRLLHSFPLEVTDGEDRFMRSFVSMDPESKTLSYAGYFTQGATLRFMRSGIIQYLDAAEIEAQKLEKQMEVPDCLFFVSCRSRYEILKQLAVEELGAVSSVFESTPIFGFYASGELLSSSSKEYQRRLVLHNQSFILLAIKEE